MTWVVAGDFNATRDYGPFSELVAAGFLDCAEAAGTGREDSPGRHYLFCA